MTIAGTVDGIDIQTRDGVLTSTTTTANAALPKAGGTMTGDLILSDDIKIELGDATGGDLQIYHSSVDNNSFVDEVGSGNLFVRGNDVVLGKYTGETYIDCNVNGSVQIYHDDSKKFETTSTGTDTTGNIVVSGTVDGVDIAARDAVLTSTTTTANAALPKAGGTVTGDIEFNDNVKASFGNDNDFEIYHSGSSSIVREASAGNLTLAGNDVNTVSYTHLTLPTKA